MRLRLIRSPAAEIKPITHTVIQNLPLSACALSSLTSSAMQALYLAFFPAHAVDAVGSLEPLSFCFLYGFLP